MEFLFKYYSIVRQVGLLWCLEECISLNIVSNFLKIAFSPLVFSIGVGLKRSKSNLLKLFAILKNYAYTLFTFTSKFLHLYIERISVELK